MLCTVINGVLVSTCCPDSHIWHKRARLTSTVFFFFANFIKNLDVNKLYLEGDKGRDPSEIIVLFLWLVVQIDPFHCCNNSRSKHKMQFHIHCERSVA